MTTKTRMPLTPEQQEEARRLVQHVLDGGGEAVLETAQKLLLARYADALSAVPEDVARDVERVERVMYEAPNPCPANCGCEDHGALSRLASAAARVPGLEASLTEARANLSAEIQRAGEALSERDEARKEATMERERTQAVMGRVEEALTERDHARGERDALQARVAELEASVLEERRAGNDFRERMGEAMEGKVLAEARATAADACLKEVRGILCAAEMESTEGAAMRVARRAGLRKPMTPTTLDNGWGDRTSPTPAPGLRGAVGKLLALHDRRMPVVQREWFEAWGLLRAAYDGTAPDDMTSAEAPKDARQWARALCRLAAHARVELGEDGFHAMLVYCDGDLLPKAATQEPVTDDTLPKARVVEVLRREHDAQVKRGRQVPAAVVRHIAHGLGLTLDAPTAPGEGEDAAWCGCDPSAVDDSGHCEKHGAEPTPGGGEAEPETCEECGEFGGHSYRPVHGAEVPRMCSKATPRVRIAPTPTPEPGGPALEGPPQLLWTGNGTRPTPPVAVQPEPAAPDVAWERGDLRVLENGHWLMRGQGVTASHAADTFARALAEAKRERARVMEAVLTAAAEAAHAEAYSVWGDAGRAKQVAEAVMEVDVSALMASKGKA